MIYVLQINQHKQLFDKKYFFEQFIIFHSSKGTLYSICLKMTYTVIILKFSSFF